MSQVAELFFRQPSLLQNRVQQEAVHFFGMKWHNRESSVWMQEMTMPALARAFFKTCPPEFSRDLSGTRWQTRSPRVWIRSQSRQIARQGPPLPSPPQAAQIRLESTVLLLRDQPHRSELSHCSLTRIPARPQARGWSWRARVLECRPTSEHHALLEPFRATCWDRLDLETAERCTSSRDQCSTEVTL
jgi:hypothetical protein